MKEAGTKVIDTLTQEDFHGAFQKSLERYNKCIATGGDYFEGIEFHVCTSNKSAHTKKSGNLLNDPRISFGKFISCGTSIVTSVSNGLQIFKLLKTNRRKPKANDIYIYVYI